MDKISDNVQYEFRVTDGFGLFGDVKIYQDKDGVFVDQGEDRILLSESQFSDVLKCMHHLAIQMGIRNAS